MKTSELRNIIAPAVIALGFELVDCELHFEQGRKIILVYIDNPTGDISTKGVTIEDCTRVSRQINATLEVEAPTMGGYTLEVSSPGLDRPLVTAAHYQRFLGAHVKIKLKNPLDGRRNFTGELLSVVDNHLQIKVDQEIFDFSIENIEKANLIPDLRF
jgi:ribosome maturation factor RimP